MKIILLSLLASSTFAAEATKAKRWISSAKAGQYTCAFTIEDGYDVEQFLQNNCDTAKPFSLSSYSAVAGYSRHNVCCVHK